MPHGFVLSGRLGLTFLGKFSCPSSKAQVISKFHGNSSWYSRYISCLSFSVKIESLLSVNGAKDIKEIKLLFLMPISFLSYVLAKE